MTIEVRKIELPEFEQFRQALMTTFGDDQVLVDPDGTTRMRALVAPGQAWAAFDGPLVVGTAASLAHVIGVPGGGDLAIAGLTMVSVRPTHRRRGLMTELMAHHLADARQRGLAASGLWASQVGIYGRFGYGIAAHNHALEIAHAHSLTVAGETFDDVAWLDEATARAQLPGIYARATAPRPGALRRTEVWWRERRFLEVPFVRGGASLRRHVVARRGDQLVGYLAYRQRSGPGGGLPSGEVSIIELHGVDPRAVATLWRFALAVDLFPTVRWGNAPIDDPLPWMVDDGRRVHRTIADNLWLRIEDVAAALVARRYPAEGILRLAVDGETWQLEARGGAANCTRTTADAELVLSRASLGALYLGGTSASQLAHAALVTGEPAALERADRMFASAVAPWCPEVF